MSDDTHSIRWAKAQIAEQDKAIASADAARAAALAKKADLLAYIRVEQSKQTDWVDHPVIGALNAAAEVFDASTRGAKKRAILQSLLKVPAAQTGWIIEAIKLLGIPGGTIENTSPQLSAYKTDGLVRLTDGGWSITQKGRDYLAEKN
jgi:hypothetical protein